ncbi:MAG: glycosyltransferase family 9 protein [Desulfuromonadales bacterium]|nr:glycosyltransferase family 9 protein [Desulfuromonadales bacterium]
MNIRLIKKLDAVFGFVAASTFPPPVHRELSPSINSLLLIRPGGIGDAVLLAPAIRLLKNTYPAINITVLAEQRNAGVFTLIPGVDRLLCYDHPRELLQALRSSYDVVIDTEQWHRLSAIVARIVSAPVKIGFDTNERRRMFTHTVPYSHDDYESLSFTHLLAPLGIATETVETVTPFLSLPDTACSKVADLLEPLCDQPFVTVFPGASIPERRWGADRFRQLADKLALFGMKTVVVGGKDDSRQGDVIVGGGSGLNLAGPTSLPETAAVIHKSALLLSGDSGVLHIAVGLDIPTVSLFGPGRAKKWAPQGGRHIVINRGLDCSPCTTFGTTPPCPIDARCLRDISVDEVVNAVTMLLTSLGTIPSRCCKRDWIEMA